jgi:hypothetical protein
MRGLAKQTIELVRFARKLLAELHPMTLRQLHYAIFSAAKIAYDNTQADYKRLSRVTSRVRRAYRTLELAGRTDLLGSSNLIPPDWIVDELRDGEQVSMWDDINGYLEAVKRSYRRNYWQDQPHHVEVWCEKATVLSSLRPVTEEYGIRLRPCRGFGSCGMEMKIGGLFEGIAKPITVYFLGDHDPSGDWIDPDMHHRVQAASGREFDMIRLAVHPADIKTFKLPPQKIKDSDKRAARFRRKYGKNAATVEVDALPVEVLRERVRNAVTAKIDWNLWNRQVSVERVELESIARFADTVRNLPQAER